MTVYGSVIGVRVLHSNITKSLHVMTARISGYMNTGTPGFIEVPVETLTQSDAPISDRSASLMADVKSGFSADIVVYANGNVCLRIYFNVAMVGYNFGFASTIVPLL